MLQMACLSYVTDNVFLSYATGDLVCHMMQITCSFFFNGYHYPFVEFRCAVWSWNCEAIQAM